MNYKRSPLKILNGRICGDYLGHISQKSSAIHKVLPRIFVSSDEKISRISPRAEYLEVPKRKTCIPMRFAHTGLTQNAPENTWESYKAAIDFGCEGIEMDIQLSGDKKVVCIHNPDLTYVTDGKDTRKLADLTLEEIQKVDIPFRNRLLPENPPEEWTEHKGGQTIKNSTEDGENRMTHLISFEEFDQRLNDIKRDITIEVEFKCLGLMEAISPILEKSKNTHRYILFSGDDEINAEIQGYYKTHTKPKDLRLGANIRFINEKTMSFVRSADLYEVGLNNEAFTKDDVDMFEKMGIKVFSNLGDYPFWWSKLSEYGVLGFKTNYAKSFTLWEENQK